MKVRTDKYSSCLGNTVKACI